MALYSDTRQSVVRVRGQWTTRSYFWSIQQQQVECVEQTSIDETIDSAQYTIPSTDCAASFKLADPRGFIKIILLFIFSKYYCKSFTTIIFLQ